jgi:formylglycine-generating enzyme required for sulfatase activity
MCYPPPRDGEPLVPYPDYLSRTGYRPPTEIEWELACRAGTTTRCFFGACPDLMAEYAWLDRNSGDGPHPVGALKPNDLGLFDVLGNVQEWCTNYCDGDDGRQVSRGGNFQHRARDLRSAVRVAAVPDHRYQRVIGFRVARTLRTTP